MALSEEFTAGIAEATEAAVAEVQSDVVNPVDPVDAVDGGGDDEAKGEKNDSESEESTDGGHSDSDASGSEGGEDGDDDGAGEGEDEDGSDEDNEAASGGETPTARNENLVERAILSGMSMRDALAFPDDQSLASTCNLLEQSHAAGREEPAGEVKPDLLKSLENLDPEKYDEGDIETIGTLVRAIRQQETQIRELQAGVDQTVQAGRGAAEAEVESWFNGEVAALGPDFKEVLGEGEHSSLAPGSPQHAKREEIAEQVSVIMAGYQATGKTLPPREEVFKVAAGIVLMDEMRGIQEKKLASALRKRGKQHISRAGRRAKGQSGETAVEGAVAALSAKYPNA